MDHNEKYILISQTKHNHVIRLMFFATIFVNKTDSALPSFLDL